MLIKAVNFYKYLISDVTIGPPSVEHCVWEDCIEKACSLKRTLLIIYMWTSQKAAGNILWMHETKIVPSGLNEKRYKAAEELYPIYETWWW